MAGSSVAYSSREAIPVGLAVIKDKCKEQAEIKVKALGDNAKYIAAMDALKFAGSLPQAVAR